MVHGTVDLKLVHGTVKIVVHGTVKFELVVHGTVMVHGTVKVGAWDGQHLEEISLSLLCGKSLHVTAGVTLYCKARSTSGTLPVNTGSAGDGLSCDLLPCFSEIFKSIKNYK